MRTLLKIHLAFAVLVFSAAGALAQDQDAADMAKSAASSAFTESFNANQNASKANQAGFQRQGELSDRFDALVKKNVKWQGTDKADLEAALAWALSCMDSGLAYYEDAANNHELGVMQFAAGNNAYNNMQWGAAVTAFNSAANYYDPLSLDDANSSLSWTGLGQQTLDFCEGLIESYGG